MSTYTVVIDVDTTLSEDDLKRQVFANIEGAKDVHVTVKEFPKQEIDELPCLYQG